MLAISLLHLNIPWHIAGVELLQQQQINGRGTVQAVNGNYCVHRHKRNKGQGSLCIYSKQISWFRKVGVAHNKQTLQWHPSLCFHIVLFLISRLT